MVQHIRYNTRYTTPKASGSGRQVRAVEFIEAIPKSASGKILRKDLRARETASA